MPLDTGIITVLAILVAVAVLLIIDRLRIDVVAILCLLALAWSGVLEPLETLAGFSSNAVIAMIAVMIMGRGIARTGIMDRFSRIILKVSGTSQPRIIVVTSTITGFMSAVIQNIGSAALILPSVLNISRSRKIPASALIMPIGFAAIVGGTLTMIGSGPLLMVNDFLSKSALQPFGLFSITPVGLALLIFCIVFFYLAGKFILPHREDATSFDIIQKKLIEDWKLSSNIWHFKIPANSILVDKKLDQIKIWEKYHLNILAVSRDKYMEYAPWRETLFEAGQMLALLGDKEDIDKFASDYKLLKLEKAGKLALLEDLSNAGFAEVVVPPRSAISGVSIREFGLRRRYGVEPLILFHKGERVSGDLSDIKIVPGDILIVHGIWENIQKLKLNDDFMLITHMETDKKEVSKSWIALACFAVAIGLSLAGLPISIAFLTGAIAMVLTRVLNIDDAYRAVDWKVVFFLAGLIPLGLAMQKTGAAAYLAEAIMTPIHGSHTFILLLVISAIATVFSLLMSNIGAAVILMPLVINIGLLAGIDPRPLVLLVAVSTANSFMLPTHQVNALLKSPGGYRNADYIKAGWGITMGYLLITVSLFYVIFYN